jgi:hypothetical protein
LFYEVKARDPRGQIFDYSDIHSIPWRAQREAEAYRKERFVRELSFQE